MALFFHFLGAMVGDDEDGRIPIYHVQDLANFSIDIAIVGVNARIQLWIDLIFVMCGIMISPQADTNFS